MKKLLILLSLTTAMTAFGAPHGNSVESATMNINATVIRPLTVEAENMEFGRVIQGSEATATARYTITGEPGQPITIELSAPTELINKANNSKLPITLTYTKPTQIANNGDASFDINGELTPETTHSGVYEGQVVARVQYQ
ncbi:MAG: DUF4402 domain-containing protein [Cetobacterium sp.]|uniref:DUF4402 domain-containing protein n=1 Tax=Cetobacterium sp. TaxID=2071632 RepID=UPI003EE5A93F